MKQIFAVLGGIAAAILGTMPASAGDSWADQIMDASKTAEQQVSRKSVRVASLGNTALETEEVTPRAKHARATKSEDRPQSRRTRVASLGNSDTGSEKPERRRSLSGGSVNWTADSGCLDGTLRHIITSLAANYGPVTVNSTCRSRSHNANVGGAPKSFHLRGEAVDFRVHSNISAVYASLRDNGNVGGLKHYGGGLFHIDTGPRRSW